MSFAIKCYLRILLSLAFVCYLNYFYLSVVEFSQTAWVFLFKLGTLPAEEPAIVRTIQPCFDSLSCLR